MISTKTLIAGALKEINSVRALVGLPAIRKIPKGNMMKSLSCPQANALKEGVDIGTCKVSVGSLLSITRKWPAHVVNIPGGTLRVAAGGETLHMNTPKYMREFITRFDDGQLKAYKA